MYLYAHDSLGMLAEMGILAPVTDFISADDEADLLPMTVEAGTYKDTQYVLPLYYESLLFIYNKDLWKGAIPKTTDDLLSYMKENTDCLLYTSDKDEYTIDNEVYKYKMQLLDEDSAESCNILCNDLSYSFENVQSDESTENYRKI